MYLTICICRSDAFLNRTLLIEFFRYIFIVLYKLDTSFNFVIRQFTVLIRSIDINAYLNHRLEYKLENKFTQTQTQTRFLWIVFETELDSFRGFLRISLFFLNRFQLFLISVFSQNRKAKEFH